MRDGRSDHLTILSGTAQNVAGLVVFVLATFGANVLLARVLGEEGLGRVTLATQLAFVAGAATRFGMDMAATRRVAVDLGTGEPGRARAIVARAVGIAALVSVAVAAAVAVGADPLSRLFGEGEVVRDALRAAAVALPFVALCQVYLGATRGLKIMRHTLFVQWMGQPLLWVALMPVVWIVAETASASVLAYAASWAIATGAAALAWRRETRGFDRLPVAEGEMADLIRYGGPRAPAALLSQLLFWADYFVLARYVEAAELGVYAAAVRVAQTLVLFLTAVNYMFSPFVADLHARGEREQLDSLYKALTRWTLAGTLPLMLLLLIAPEPVLRIFGGGFGEGTTAVRILLIGQVVNVAVGSVGFILIMVGRTGWDLAVYAATFALDVGLALALAPQMGAEGAAVAQAVTLAVANALRLYLVWRFVRIQPFSRSYARLLVPALMAGAVMAGVHALVRDQAWPIDLAATGLVGVIAYAIALTLLGLTKDERALARTFLSRLAASRRRRVYQGGPGSEGEA